MFENIMGTAVQDAVQHDYDRVGISVSGSGEYLTPSLTFLDKDGVAHCFEITCPEELLGVIGSTLSVALPEEGVKVILSIIEATLAVSEDVGRHSVAQEVVNSLVQERFDASFQEIISDLDTDEG